MEESPVTQTTSGSVKDFLNPKSMLTPGVAGSITMMIGNTMWVQFGLEPKWTGIVLSFLLGLLVFTAMEMTLWQRILYWLLNSLIIFSVGVGTNSLGAAASQHAKTGPALGSLLVPSAYAQGYGTRDTERLGPSLGGRKDAEERRPSPREDQRGGDREHNPYEAGEKPDAGQRGFFKGDWSFSDRERRR